MSSSIWSLLLAGVENFVIINAALSILAFGAASLVRAYTRSRGWHPLSLSRLYATALVAPPLVSAWVIGASLLPAVWLGAERWVAEHQAAHTLHLFNALTISVDPELGYAALAFALLTFVAATYTAASAYFRIGRVIRRLEVGSEPALPERIKQVEDACQKYGIDVGLVMSRYPFSFVWGYLRSKLIVSTGLLNALSPEELSALLEHEAAHHARRDNLSKWALTVCRYSSPAFLLTGLLYRWWGEQVEMVCDEVAAKRTSAPVEVAGAIVRLKRMTAPLNLQTAESSFLGEGSNGFERRVTRLLDLTDQESTREVKSLARSCAKPAAVVGSLFLLSLAMLFLLSPMAIHRVIEALLH